MPVVRACVRKCLIYYIRCISIYIPHSLIQSLINLPILYTCDIRKCVKYNETKVNNVFILF